MNNKLSCNINPSLQCIILSAVMTRLNRGLTIASDLQSDLPFALGKSDTNYTYIEMYIRYLYLSINNTYIAIITVPN